MAKTAKIAKSKTAKASAARNKPAPSNTYWHRSQQPLSSLIMLLPLIALYEAGVLWFAGDRAHGGLPDVLAHSLIAQFVAAFGITSAATLPGLIVVVLLLSMHVAHGQRAPFAPRLYLGMGLEAALLAVPLFVLMLVFRQQMWALRPLAAGAAAPMTWQAQMFLSLGAGIYEELLFRVIAIALVHWLLVDYLALPDSWGTALTVALSALAFALYHFDLSAGPGEPNAFQFSTFICYAFGGVYLAVVYVLRGFGIAAGTHATYDILVTLVTVLCR
jgi:hypothetical protein